MHSVAQGKWQPRKGGALMDGFNDYCEGISRVILFCGIIYGMIECANFLALIIPNFQ